MIRSLTKLCLLSVVILGLNACGSDDGLSNAISAYPYVRLSPSAPPLKPVEEKPQPTQPMKEIWREGFWQYDGRSFNWVSGYYMLRPHPTAAWTPDRWEQRAFGWAFVPGYWQ